MKNRTDVLIFHMAICAGNPVRFSPVMAKGIIRKIKSTLTTEMDSLFAYFVLHDLVLQPISHPSYRKNLHLTKRVPVHLPKTVQGKSPCQAMTVIDSIPCIYSVEMTVV